MPINQLAGILTGAAIGRLLVGVTELDGDAITVPGFIPRAAGASLEKADGIVVSYLTTPEDPSSVRAEFFVVTDIGDLINLGVISGYGGSGLGNPAGFDKSYLGGNLGAGGDTFHLYTYNNGEDAMVDILAADYFNDAADILEIGDVLYVTSSQGEVDTRGADLLKVTDIVDGVVTVAATDFDQFVAP